MNFQIVSALIYMLPGAAIIYLFQVRRRALSEFNREQFPGLDEETFAELKLLLKTAYERMLYMGILFFPLAFSSWYDDSFVSALFFMALIILLFISNIPPRHKILLLLENKGLSIKELQDNGIKL